MKKAFRIIVIALLLTTFGIGNAQAQRRAVRYLSNYENEPYHFGFLLGFNSMMYTIKTIEGYQNIPQQPNQWPAGPFNPDETQNLYVYNVETQTVPGFTVGSITKGKLANFYITKPMDTIYFMSYGFGSNKVEQIYLRGKRV